MPFLSLVAALTESLLNRVLWQDRALKTVRQRLKGQVLALYIRDIKLPLFLVFSETRVDVLTAWEGKKDCQITLGLAELRELRDKQQITQLLKDGRIDVEGSLQLVQQFSALLDLAELDPANFLAKWIGDIPAEQIIRISSAHLGHLKHVWLKTQQQTVTLLNQNWQVLPNALEIAWFCDETVELENAVFDFEQRLKKQENS